MNIMSIPWSEALHEKPVEEWAALVALHTNPDLRRLLSSPKPPTVDDTRKLPWVDTTNWGSYGCMLIAPSAQDHSHLYVGAATSASGGLRERNAGHCSPTILKKEKNYFHSLIYDYNKEYIGPWKAARAAKETEEERDARRAHQAEQQAGYRKRDRQLIEKGLKEPKPRTPKAPPTAERREEQKDTCYESIVN
ncbi:hypothetical protein SLS55_007693 [Diplodia seriata]|uniref:GIY-YIG domain-containing protein n=1 Tax=Diplodia seriata TaxID=420778 RepID=A0ABR3CBP9_9PEZI